MTLYHQKATKPGKRWGAPPKRRHPWKMGLKRLGAGSMTKIEFLEVQTIKLPKER